MAKNTNVGEITKAVYDLLESFSSEDRVKIVKAVLTLLGEGNVNAPCENNNQERGGIINCKESDGGENISAQEYFDQKEPKTKIEELAVAAKLREDRTKEKNHSKDELKDIIIEARRNFDERNFNCDLENAKKKGLFNRQKEITLSYIGHNYIDALPDRGAAKKTINKRSRKKTTKKKTTKKKTKKAKTQNQ